ncbi:MAG TPA: hypothetical protein VLO30_09515 [Chthoniobacterales bacterium]|nr:hypothetical protein [Chthoniobacterales bacterium]
MIAVNGYSRTAIALHPHHESPPQSHPIRPRTRVRLLVRIPIEEATEARVETILVVLPATL